MAFPSYVHSVIPNSEPSRWPVVPQGHCECDFTATANALNLLLGERRYTKDEFIRQAGVLFQPRLGGTISPLKVWQLRRRHYGTHYGNLSRTDYEHVLRDLIDRGVPVIVELGVAFQFASVMIYGRHTVVLVGYSNQYTDAQGQTHEEYYLVDSEWPVGGRFELRSNDVDRDGDGVVESFPGNRTLSRDEFRGLFRTGLYCPVFPTAAAHSAWYRTLGVLPRVPVLGWLNQVLFSGSYDLWHAT